MNTNPSKNYKVEFLDLSKTYIDLKDELDDAYFRVMAKGHYIRGEECDLFEKEFASYVGAKHAVGVANGLDALRLILVAYGIGAGDEVLVPSHTFIATWLAVTSVGATPIPIEPSYDDYLIDLTEADHLITNKTRAIIPVHLYGQTTNMDQVRSFAKKYNLLVIEDAAQSHGAKFRGVSAGNLGDAAAFSFYPGKNLGGFGDGGMITTNNSALADKIRCISNYGSKKKYYHEVEGLNSRLDEIQAALLRIKLKNLNQWNERRNKISDYYTNNIINPDLNLPKVQPHCYHVWHLFVISCENREKVMNRLEQEGIQTLIHYPIPCHKSEIYKNLYQGYDLTIAEKLASRILSLPIGPHLSDSKVEYVVETINKIVA